MEIPEEMWNTLLVDQQKSNAMARTMWTSHGTPVPDWFEEHLQQSYTKFKELLTSFKNNTQTPNKDEDNRGDRA